MLKSTCAILATFTSSEHGLMSACRGLERKVAQAIVDATHGVTCAYSNATRGNIDVTLNVV